MAIGWPVRPCVRGESDAWGKARPCGCGGYREGGIFARRKQESEGERRSMRLSLLRSRLVLVALACLGSLVLAACGSDSGGSSDSAGGSGSSTTAKTTASSGGDAST